MGKRYYCNYCDKTMVSSQSIIKTHNKGVAHQKLVSEHYQQYKDPETIFKEESTKKPCLKFAKGQCQFGGICRYSHYTVQDLHELRSIAEKCNRNKKNSDLESSKEFNTKEIESNNTREKLNTIYDENGVTHVFPWTYNPLFESFENLPPSIKRFKSSDFTNLSISNWG